MNDQKPEPHADGDGNTLDVHSIFFTIQGEGPFTGHRAIFIRLAGCNLQCPGCDTEYTQGRRRVPIEQIMVEAWDVVPWLITSTEGSKPLIVITGGEPLRQVIGPFVMQLLQNDFAVQIESNGVFKPDPVLFDLLAVHSELTLVVSPKTSRIHDQTARLAKAFKYVLDADSVDPQDGLPIKALEHPASTGVARPPKGKPVYLNPCDSKDPVRNAANLTAVAQSCVKHGYIMGVQLHKLVGLD